MEAECSHREVLAGFYNLLFALHILCLLFFNFIQMKLKTELQNEYVCDKCGKEGHLKNGTIHSLSTSVATIRGSNLGVRHLCVDCVSVFKAQFKLFFTHLNEITKNHSKTNRICSICNEAYSGYGNNAEPINSGRCCDPCNQQVIIERLNNYNIR
tara:strand:+ start:1384 stop:1848 length:465 start_codon:yes stop_codon:yes gene_type:complete